MSVQPTNLYGDSIEEHIENARGAPSNVEEEAMFHAYDIVYPFTESVSEARETVLMEVADLAASSCSEALKR